MNPVTFGTTSACAENTPKSPAKLTVLRNYLRVRGEYYNPHAHHDRATELPPRARRIRHEQGVTVVVGGTTSACAENTTTSRSSPTKQRNYLRVHGEYSPSNNHSIVSMELPPRARRIQHC